MLGAVVLFANWPYTICVIMSTNRRLMDTAPEAATAETRRTFDAGEVMLASGFICDPLVGDIKSQALGQLHTQHTDGTPLIWHLSKLLN